LETGSTKVARHHHRAVAFRNFKTPVLDRRNAFGRPIAFRELDRILRLPRAVAQRAVAHLQRDEELHRLVGIREHHFRRLDLNLRDARSIRREAHGRGQAEHR
jgi:hypothetical protein